MIRRSFLKGLAAAPVAGPALASAAMQGGAAASARPYIGSPMAAASALTAGLETAEHPLLQMAPVPMLKQARAMGLISEDEYRAAIRERIMVHDWLNEQKRLELVDMKSLSRSAKQRLHDQWKTDYALRLADENDGSDSGPFWRVKYRLMDLLGGKGG